jgi:O-antigen ligase
MLVFLIILSALIWLPFLLHQMAHRGLLILVVWLCVGPAISNLVDDPGRNPLFPPSTFAEADEQQQPNVKRNRGGGYFSQTETIKVSELLEPTRILFGLFLIMFLGHSFIRHKRLMTLDRTETWMLVFSLLVLANALLFSKRLAFSARVAVDAFIVPFIAYFTARRLVPDEHRFSQFIRVMAYFGCFLVVICLIERYTHPTLVHRVQGPFKTRDYLYVALMVIFFNVAIEAFLQWSKRQHTILPKWVHGFVLLGHPIVIVLTLTRGNWVGFLAGLWTFGLLSHKLLVRRQKLAMVGLIIGLVPIVLIGAQELLETSLIGERATKIATIETRLRTYALVVEAAGKNPVFGIGLNNLRDYLRERSRYVDGKILGTAHNSYLAIFAELGIFALIAYLAIMWSIYRTGFRIFRTAEDPTARWRGMGAIAMLTAYLVPGLFTHLVYGQLFAHIYLFASLGAIVGRYRLPQLRAAPMPVPARIKESLSPILITGKS